MSHQQTKKSDSEVQAEFEQYYLQRATRELGEDLDKVRTADDFKNDAISMLVHALKQGAEMWDLEDKRGIVEAGKADKS
jgi:ribosome assembly protein 3